MPWEEITPGSMLPPKLESEISVTKKGSIGIASNLVNDDEITTQSPSRIGFRVQVFYDAENRRVGLRPVNASTHPAYSASHGELGDAFYFTSMPLSRVIPVGRHPAERVGDMIIAKIEEA